MRSLGLLIVPALLAALASPAYAQPGLEKKRRAHINSLAPYVPSPQAIVEKMLEMADVKPGETVYDLGSGDGRILITAAKKFQAKAVGVELSEDLVKQATNNISKEGLQNHARVIHGNMVEVDVSPADVVVIYLLTLSNDIMKPLLERQLRPGTRVVSHDFKVRGWIPKRDETVIAHGRSHRIYVYEIPKP